MGEALIRGLLKTGLIPPEDLFVTDVRRERLEELARLYGLHTLSDNALLVRRVDVVILAVKPQILAGVLQEIAPAVSGRLLISIAAGVPIAAIEPRAARVTTRVVRAMPNTPALVDAGATAISRRHTTENGRPRVRQAHLRRRRHHGHPRRGADGRRDRAVGLRPRL